MPRAFASMEKRWEWAIFFTSDDGRPYIWLLMLRGRHAAFHAVSGPRYSGLLEFTSRSLDGFAVDDLPGRHFDSITSIA